MDFIFKLWSNKIKIKYFKHFINYNINKRREIIVIVRGGNILFIFI